MSNESEEKTLPPSEQKLRKAREKGQVSNSADFVQAMTTVVGIVYIIFNWQGMFNTFSSLFDMSVISFNEDMKSVGFALFMAVVFEVMYAITPFVILVILVSVVANLLDKKGIPFSLESIKPDFKKINPGEGLKKFFKKRNATEFALSFVKLMIWFSVTTIFIVLSVQTILASIYCSLGCVIESAADIGLLLIVTAAIMLLITGLLDLPLQSFLFRDEQKMGHNEMKRELKDMLGSPEFRQHRRNEHQKAVSGGGSGTAGQGSGEVKDGEKGMTAIIRSFDKAVGIYFHPEHADVPIVVAKFKGSSFRAELGKAESNGIPVIEDLELAPDLFRTVDQGRVIQERHFERIARILVAVGSIG